MTLLTSLLVHLIAEKVGSMVLWNAGNHSPCDAMSCPTTLESKFNAVGGTGGGLQTEIMHGTG